MRCGRRPVLAPAESGSAGSRRRSIRSSACSPMAAASAASALSSPRSSSASGRRRRAIRRTSSVPWRAVSRSSSSWSLELVRDPPGQSLHLQHDAGECLADLVVQLARDPLALALLNEQRPASAVAPLGLQPVEHLVEGLRQARRSPARRSTRTRLPGESGSCPRMVSTSSSSGRNAGRSSARLSVSRADEAHREHDQLDRRGRHRHRHRREDQRQEREHQHRCVSAEHPPEQRQRVQPRAHGSSFPRAWRAARVS